MSDLVEKIARAICWADCQASDKPPQCSGPHDCHLQAMAREAPDGGYCYEEMRYAEAALAALSAEGLVLVSLDKLDSVHRYLEPGHRTFDELMSDAMHADDLVRAMLAAAEKQDA